MDFTRHQDSLTPDEAEMTLEEYIRKQGDKRIAEIEVERDSIRKEVVATLESLDYTKFRNMYDKLLQTVFNISTATN